MILPYAVKYSVFLPYWIGHSSSTWLRTRFLTRTATVSLLQATFQIKDHWGHLCETWTAVSNSCQRTIASLHHCRTWAAQFVKWNFAAANSCSFGNAERFFPISSNMLWINCQLGMTTDSENIFCWKLGRCVIIIINHVGTDYTYIVLIASHVPAFKRCW